jgi:hypothetical protein
MKKLETGNMKTKDIVDIFGTQTLKKKVEGGYVLSGRDKNLLVEKAKKYCDIESLGKGKFIIHKVYGIKNDSLVLPLKKGLYQYLAPIILNKLLHEQDHNYKITLPFLGWARQFEIINANYSFIKNHQYESSRDLQIDQDIMFEYFERIDDCIKYYLNECLSILGNKKGLDLIDYDCVTMVVKGERREEEEKGFKDIVCVSNPPEVISDYDHKFVIDCENQARLEAGIESPKEKFYGAKSLLYKDTLKKLLAQRQIKYTFTAYNIFCKNKEGVRDVIEKFGLEEMDFNQFILDFNDKFVDYIQTKAKIRQNKEIKKSNDEDIDQRFLKKHRLMENYMEEMKRLTDITVRHDADNIRDSITVKDSVYAIMQDFNMTIRRG